MRDSLVFYKSFSDAAENLQPDDYKEFMQMLFGYAFEGKEPENTQCIAYSMFLLVKPQIDANNKRYENGRKGAEYGHLGGRPKNPKKTPKKPQENPKETPNVNVNENVNVNDKDIGTFVPLFSPSVEEALSAFIEIRQKKGSLITGKSLEILRNKVANLYRNDEERLEGINKAILHGWKDLYPLDYQKKKNAFTVHTNPADDDMVQALKIN